MTENSHDPLRACHHIGVAVHDLPTARHFWGEALGLEELERPPEIQHFPSVWYRLGITELHVVENKEFVPNRDQLAPHIAMAVRPEDLEAVVERVKAAGYAFLFGPAKGPDGILRAVVDDPTGNRIELTTGEMRRTSV